MTTIFDDSKEAVRHALPPQQQRPPAPTPSAHPPLPTAGAPSSTLAGLNFWGSMQDFNQRVQKIHDNHLLANGVAPNPQTMLKLALSTGNEFQVAPGVPLSRAVAQRPVVQTNPMILSGLAGYASQGSKGYEQWMDEFGDQLDAMLRNPDTHAQAAAALANAKRTAAAVDNGPGVGYAVVHAATYTAHVADAALRVLGSLDQVTTPQGSKEQSRRTAQAISGFEAVAPAIAQVVQGLVYSPVAGARVANALLLDLGDLSRGSQLGENVAQPMPFHRTITIAKETGDSMLYDLAHPGSRAGFLFLDGLGIASLGAGTAVRLGRIGGVEGVAAKVRAFRAPHDMETFTLTKEGLGEEIKLAQNPLVNWAQEYTPGVGLRARQGRLNRGGGVQVEATDLAGNQLGNVLPPTRMLFPDKLNFLNWAQDLLSSESMIGRAHDRRLTTEYRAVAGVGAHLADFYGAAGSDNWLTSLLPDRLMNGLRPGERKAIEAFSYPISQGRDPLAAMEAAEQYLLENGIGDAKAHQTSIARLAAARKELENPRPQLQQALDAVRTVVTETQSLKLKMGLTEQTAAERVAKAGYMVENAPEFARNLQSRNELKAATQAIRDAKNRPEQLPAAQNRLAQAQENLAANPYPLVEMEDGRLGYRVGETVVPLNSPAPGSFYFPHILKTKPSARGSLNVIARRASSPFGLSKGLLPTELRHEMTGDAYLHGDYRLDIPNLQGEQLARTAKSWVQWQDWQRAWDNGLELPKPGYIAVRDIRTVPDDIRRVLGDFLDEHLDQANADLVPDDLHQWLFPDRVASDENVRWIDPRTLGETTRTPLGPAGGFTKFAATINDLMRPFIFFLQPKYALNGLGNYAMLALDEGFLRSGANLARAMTLDDDLHTRVAAQVGAGKSLGYVSELSGGINRALAEFWSRLTDDRFRTASFLHYARVKGFVSDEELSALLTDRAHAAVLNDVTERAKDALVNFDRMSGWEKARLRNYIFVYPWQRGAFFWSFRTILEHPAKTALLATLGADAYHDETWLKEAAAWVRRTGYLPLDWAMSKTGIKELEAKTGIKGSPAMLPVWNPTSINTFATLNDAMQAGRALVTGDKYANVGNVAGPPIQLAIHVATGTDNYGNAYQGSQFWGAVQDVLGIVPIIAAVKRSQKDLGPAMKDFDVTDRASLQTRLNSALHQAVTNPGWLDGFGSLIYGSQGELNLNALAARYWRDATPQQRQQRTVRLLQMALAAQGDFLGRPVPQDVRQAVTEQAQLSWALQQHAQKLQRSNGLTLKEVATFTVSYYRDAGKMPARAARAWQAKIDAATAPADLKAFTAAVSHRYGNLAQLQVWDSDVRQQNAAYTQFPQRMGNLLAQGLIPALPGKTTDPQRLDYARAYTRYLDERRGLDEQLKGRPDRQAQLAIFDDEHDKPSGGLPSPVRLSFTEGSAEQQRLALVADFDRPWKNLNAAAKTALGQPVPQGVSLAWGQYDEAVRQIRQRDGSVSRDQRDAVAAQLSSANPGFAKDYALSKQPRIFRFEQTPLYKDLPERSWFDQNVGEYAKQAARALTAGADPQAVRSYWKQWVTEKVLPAIKTDPDLQALRQALAGYPATFLTRLLSNG